MTQAQFNKGDKIIQESKDKVISSLPIMEASTSYITGEHPKGTILLPSHEHPFDHFVLVATLDYSCSTKNKKTAK